LRADGVEAGMDDPIDINRRSKEEFRRPDAVPVVAVGCCPWNGSEASLMRRREFIAGLGVAVAWPLAARAQQGDRAPRIGVLMGWDENDPQAKAGLSEFAQGLGELGWIDGRNMRIDVRWAAGSVSRARMDAKELVDLQLDVILANTTPVTAALLGETRTIPIVFVVVSDPVGAGFVASLARPGGNITGFINVEAAMAGKWLQLLTEVAPTVKRVAIMFNPDTAPGGGSYYLPSFGAAARSLKVEPIVAPVHNDAEIEAVINSLGREPRGGLVVMTDSFMQVHRAPVILLAARNNVPAVYSETVSARDGGLLSYGAVYSDIFRRAASYVDRILRGATPAELPVQLPTKFVMAVNFKTAEALGLTVPQSILLQANEVIE
jgi:putative tryptophan/tyrosine transport system substrate-binding protein